MSSASEKRVWVTPTVFNTTKNVVLIVQTKFKTAENIVSATSLQSPPLRRFSRGRRTFSSSHRLLSERFCKQSERR